MRQLPASFPQICDSDVLFLKFGKAANGVAPMFACDNSGVVVVCNAHRKRISPLMTFNVPQGCCRRADRRRRECPSCPSMLPTSVL